MNFDLHTLQIIGGLLAAGATAIGIKELIHYGFKKLLSMREQRALALQQGKAKQQAHELETAGTLIEQFRKQNEIMNTWFMEFASQELQHTADETRVVSKEVGDLRMRIKEVYTQQDVVLRELQGLVQEVIEMKASLMHDFKDAMETEIQVSLHDMISDILPKQIKEVLNVNVVKILLTQAEHSTQTLLECQDDIPNDNSNGPDFE